MYFAYQPDEGSEWTLWEFRPDKMMSPECEAVERRTGMNFTAAAEAARKGSVACRRAFLHVFLKRDHEKLRYEDLTFSFAQVDVRYTEAEYAEMRQQVVDSGEYRGAELEQILDKLDEEAETKAVRVDDEGKASLPSVD